MYKRESIRAGVAGQFVFLSFQVTPKAESAERGRHRILFLHFNSFSKSKIRWHGGWKLIARLTLLALVIWCQVGCAAFLQQQDEIVAIRQI
jgi:hypothetical protein